MSKTLIVYYSRKGENSWNGSIKSLSKGNTEFSRDITDYAASFKVS